MALPNRLANVRAPMRRPKKPKRKPGLRWIYARWRDTAEAWEWCPAPRVNGRLIWGRSYPTQEEAFEAAKEIRERHAVVTKVQGMTLRQACERAIRQLEADGGSEHTVKGYRARFGRWYEILEADAPIAALQPEDIEHLKLKRRTDHGVGNNTIRSDLVILQRVLDVAGLVGDANPVRKIQRPKVSDPHRPFFTMAEVAQVAAKIRASDMPARDEHADVIVFLAMTGARAFEIDRLRSGHLEELDNGGCCIVLHGNKGRRQEARRVFVAPGLAAIARRFLRGCASKPPITAEGIALICKRWAKRLGEPRLSGRVLRRTYATETALHVPLQYVQKLMGHTQLTTTQKYLGVDPRLAQAAAEQLHSALGATPPAPRRSPGQQPADGSASPGTRATPPAVRPASGLSPSELPDPCV